MDYPHPWITLDPNGRPDISHAYAIGVGAWDKVSIQYGYSQFAQGTDERIALNDILSKAQASGLYFITDQDSRPQGGAHPYSHLWDNGPDPAAELERILTVRSAALAQFGENAIPMGIPMADIEDTLVPLYLLHRYQTEAAAKEVGGLNYRYALRGDGQMVTEYVSPANQRKALAALMKTVSPSTLTLPDSLLQILPPRPPGYPRTQESFAARTGVTFDPQWRSGGCLGDYVRLALRSAACLAPGRIPRPRCAESRAARGYRSDYRRDVEGSAAQRWAGSGATDY